MEKIGTDTESILLVDDNPTNLQVLFQTLDGVGCKLLVAKNGEIALSIAGKARPDLILLDIMMPGIDGYEVCRQLKSVPATSDIPVIFLSALGETEDKVKGLHLGAVDYITKPFSPRELIARINAVLRRSQAGSEERPIEFAGLQLDPVGHRVQADGRRLDLAPTEYRLLRFFMTNPDRVYSREQLLDHVWGRGVFVEERTVDVHIRRLRKALEPHGLESMVQTVRGVGYRFSVRPS